MFHVYVWQVFGNDETTLLFHFYRFLTDDLYIGSVQSMPLFCNGYFTQFTLLKTNSSPLRIGLPKRKRNSSSNLPLSGAKSLLVSGRLVLLLQLSHEKNPGWLGYIGDYTTQLYGDYSKPL